MLILLLRFALQPFPRLERLYLSMLQHDQIVYRQKEDVSLVLRQVALLATVLLEQLQQIRTAFLLVVLDVLGEADLEVGVEDREE